MKCCGTRNVASGKVKEAWRGSLDPPQPYQSKMEETTKKKQARVIPTPVSMTFRVFGMHPCTYDPSTQHYSVRWCSPPVIHTIFNFVWFSVLLITSSVGMARLFLYPQFLKDSGSDEMQLLGVLIIVGCLFNAWVNVLARLILLRPFCDFFNKWRDLASSTDLNPFRNVGLILSVYIAFLICFLGVIGAVCTLGSSHLFLATVELLARVLLLATEEWLVGTKGQVMHAVVGVVVVQVYMVYKLALFLFVAACHFLQNSLEAWLAHLTSTIDALWEAETAGGGGGGGGIGGGGGGGGGGCGSRYDLGQLVHLHYQVVKMVRHTERLFSPTLQCFYASQVVTLCLELYLVAYRVGIGATFELLEAAWQILVIVQTCLVFLFVSLKASSVAETADKAIDILRRGLPFNACDKDKYHFGELITAVTSDRICITGGKFFYINRPFIITVVGAVVSYFVIVLQLKLPSVSAQEATGD